MNELMKVGILLPLFDLNGKQAKIGDRIRYSTTDGKIVDNFHFNWDEKNLCVCIGIFPFFKILESAFIQSVRPGKGNFDFEII